MSPLKRSLTRMFSDRYSGPSIGSAIYRPRAGVTLWITGETGVLVRCMFGPKINLNHGPKQLFRKLVETLKG